MLSYIDSYMFIYMTLHGMFLSKWCWVPVDSPFRSHVPSHPRTGHPAELISVDRAAAILKHGKATCHRGCLLMIKCWSIDG